MASSRGSSVVLSDRAVNALLTLVWLLLLVSLSRRSGESPATLGAAERGAAAVAGRAAAPTSLPQPAWLWPLHGRCFFFVPTPPEGKDRELKVELCPLASVRHISMPKYRSVPAGSFAAVVPPGSEPGAPALRHTYLAGADCPGFGRSRETIVDFVCKRDAQWGVDLVSFTETDLCRYTLVVGLKEACA